MIYLFPDTNFLLHYTFIDEVDWSFAATHLVSVVISPNTYREIDDHKHRFDDNKKQQRAKALNRFLASKVEDENPSLKNGYPLIILPTAALPSLDGALNLEVPDDRYLASVLEYRNRNNSECIVISADIGVAVKCKQIGIPCARPPEHLLLPEREDPLVSQNRNLQAENSRLKNLQPHLKLASVESKNFVELLLTKPRYFSEDDVANSIDNLRQQYPPISGAYFDSPLATSSADIRAKRARRYNEDLQVYFQEMRKFLSNISKPSKYDLIQRLCGIPLLLVNSGTTPAKEVEIFLSVSEPGISIFSEEPEFIPIPTVPTHPDNAAPRDSSEKYDSQFDMPVFDPFKLEWRDEGLNSIALYTKKVSHHDKIELPNPYVVFESVEHMSNFTINYRITADNIVEPFESVLNVKVSLK